MRQEPRLAQLQERRFKAGGRYYRATHATITVPENRGKASSRSITLPVIHAHSPNPDPGEPIFWLAGGPGMSNLAFEPPAGLLANHDVVLAGYRGVDGSARLDSPEIRQALRHTGGDLLAPRSLDTIRRAIAQTARRLGEEGVDLEGYTIQKVVADLEAVRHALGYSRINLLSASYGTRVAQVYAYLHPERLHRSAMIGVNPPGRFVWEPGTIDAQLEYYASLCGKDASCRARTPDLATTLRRVAANMPRRWLLFSIDPGKVKAVTFALLFNRKTAALAFDSYIAAERGDASGLALMSLAFDFVLPGMFTWGDFFAKGLSADLDPTRDYAAELNPPGSILGSPVSLLTWGPAAGTWPAPAVPPELQQVQPLEVETLLVSGSVDFSTPAEYARDELLPALRKGKQVILAEMGHVNDLLALQPKATERLLASFFDTGDADDSQFVYAPMPFRVPVGFPRLAKALIAAALLLAGAVSAAVYRVARNEASSSQGT